jgi:hypothetical protein
MQKTRKCWAHKQVKSKKTMDGAVGDGRSSELTGIAISTCWNFNQARCAKTVAHAMAERGAAACRPTIAPDWSGAAI